MKTTFNPENYRIENIQKATVNGRKVKLFKAYEKRENDFIFIGTFTASPKVLNRYLINTLNYGA